MEEINVNYSLADRDTAMLSESVNKLLLRRRQLAVLRLNSFDEFIKLWVDYPMFKAVNDLTDGGSRIKEMLYTTRAQLLEVPGVLAGKTIHVNMQMSNRGHFVGLREGYAKVIKSSPGYPAFRAWLEEAVKVQLCNELTKSAFDRVLYNSTTYQQMHKALPESLRAISAYSSQNTVSSYHWRAAADKKLKSVLANLDDRTTKSRARTLPDEVTEVLKKRKELIETTLATAVMLPHHDGQGRDTDYDPTWIRGDLLPGGGH